MKCKPRVAFIGSSPIVMLYVDRISEFADCTVFEGGKIGGAWADTYIAGINAPNFNNIVCPLKSSEEKFIDDIESTLLSRGAIIAKYNTNLDLAISYKPKQHILGHFSPLLLKILSKKFVSLVEKQVFCIDVEDNTALIDGEKFDAVVIPSNCSLEKITVNNTTLEIHPQISVSEHVRVCFTARATAPYYSENLDNIFDRGGIFFQKPNIFIGRIRREMKGKGLSNLLEISNFFQENINEIIIKEINEYQHYRLLESEIMTLNTSLKNTSAFLVETRQFVDAFSRIEKNCALIELNLSDKNRQ